MAAAEEMFSKHGTTIGQGHMMIQTPQLLIITLFQYKYKYFYDYKLTRAVLYCLRLKCRDARRFPYILSTHNRIMLYE